MKTLDFKTCDFKEGTVLLLDKPLEWTSFDIVKKVRSQLQRALNLKKLKVGHAGTLDPLASGLMVVCTGKATKKIETFQYQTKEYVTTLKLGETTPSFDVETEVDQTFPFEHITSDLIKETLPCFVGKIMQVPPAFSAVKVNGKRAYQMARKGEQVELRAKPLVIDDIEVLDFQAPFLTLRIVCSKGTYIRALARDIGIALKSGAHLTALRRTRIGTFEVGEALSPEEFQKKLANIETK